MTTGAAAPRLKWCGGDPQLNIQPLQHAARSASNQCTAVRSRPRNPKETPLCWQDRGHEPPSVHSTLTLAVSGPLAADWVAWQPFRCKFLSFVPGWACDEGRDGRTHDGLHIRCRSRVVRPTRYARIGLTSAPMGSAFAATPRTAVAYRILDRSVPAHASHSCHAGTSQQRRVSKI